MNCNVSLVDQILNGLRYQNIGRIRSDAMIVLRQIPSLQACSGTFTYNNGISTRLLNLSGTIPIFYNGQQYNTPIEIWLPEMYPFTAPQSYVRPTKDMMIKPGHPYVNQDGLVSIPYSTNWSPHTHTLIELIGHQCSIFGHHPPVFRRPNNLNQQNSPSPYIHTNPQNQPLSPYNGVSLYHQQETTSAYRSNIPNPPNHLNVTNPPIPPSHPYTPYSPYSKNTVNNTNLVYKSAQSQIDPKQELIKNATIIIQEETKKTFKKIADEMDAQFQIQQKLSSGNEKIRKDINQINEREVLLRKSTIQMKEKETEIKNWFIVKDNQDKLDPDSIIFPVDTWSKQQFEAFADMQMIDDILYYMDRALSNGSIDLQCFLKEVRKLSRQQFTAIALLEKIHEAQNKMYER